MPKDKAVIKKEEAALPIPMADLELMSGQGFECADKDSYAIPFLRILQPTSPQIEEGGPAYIEGAKAGMFLNTVSNELLGRVLDIIPLHYFRDFVEWLPGRKGFVKSHGSDPAILERIKTIDDKNISYLDNGNVIQDVRNHYVLLADYIHMGPIILSLVSTGIRHSRKWMSRMNALRIPGSVKQAPMFASVWTVETTRNSNDDGTWYQLGDKTTTSIEFSRWVTKPELDFAISGRDLITSGVAKADYESTVETGETSPSDGRERGPAPGMGEDVPF